MPACLVTGHPRATSTGPLAQPGPKPSPARVQGPQAGPTSPSPAAVPKGRKPTWAGCPQASRPCDGVRHCCPSAGLWEPHGDGTAALHPPIPSIPTLPPQGKELASASCFPPAAPQDAMQSSLMHLDSFMGMRKCFQVSHKVPLRSQYGSLFLVPRIDNAFPSHPGAPAPRGTLSASTHCREWGCVWGHVWGCGAAATSLCSQRSWVQGGARPHPTSQPGCSFRMQGAEHGPILQTTWVLAFLAHGVLHSTHGCSPASPHVAFAQEHLHSSTSQETDGEGCSALGLGTRPPCTPMGAGPPEAPRSPQLSPFRGAAGRAKATQQRCTHLGLRAIYL